MFFKVKEHKQTLWFNLKILLFLTLTQNVFPQAEPPFSFFGFIYFIFLGIK